MWSVRRCDKHRPIRWARSWLQSPSVANSTSCCKTSLTSSSPFYPHHPFSNSPFSHGPFSHDACRKRVDFVSEPPLPMRHFGSGCSPILDIQHRLLQQGRCQRCIARIARYFRFGREHRLVLLLAMASMWVRRFPRRVTRAGTCHRTMALGGHGESSGCAAGFD